MRIPNFLAQIFPLSLIFIKMDTIKTTDVKKPKITKTVIDLYVIEKVKELRESRKVGQKKLSSELKLSISYVGRAENIYSNTKYNFNHVNEIARYFNVPFAYFFPPTNLEIDCIEDYLNKHPRVKNNYEKMMHRAEEKARLKREEKERKKKEKAAEKANTKKKK